MNPSSVCGNTIYLIKSIGCLFKRLPIFACFTEGTRRKGSIFSSLILQMKYRRAGGLMCFFISWGSGYGRKRIFALLVSGVPSSDDGVIVRAFRIWISSPPAAPGDLKPFLISWRPGNRRKRIFALLLTGVTSTDGGVIVSGAKAKTNHHHMASARKMTGL